MKNVKDIYALSPMQEVMLMHTASHAGNDVLFNQFCYEIHGELDAAAFERAWQQLLERHDILRTAFLWENLKNPIQVVREKTTLPVELLDWRGQSESRRESLLQQFCEADRKRGFDPRKAPLMRIALSRYSDESHYFIWSSHHLLLDRWCLQIVFDDLFKAYKSARDGTEPDWEDAEQFRKYIDWIKRQNKSSAEEYWRTSLAGYSEAVRLTTVAADAEGESQSIRLNDRTDSSLRALAKSSGVTLSVLAQGAWSLTLNRLLDRQDVVFGVVVAGRPTGLDGVESIIGSFVNNVPVRVRLPREMSLRDWLQSSQLAQHQRGSFEYVAPTSIQRWSDLPVGDPMFDTLIVTFSSTGVADSVDFELVPLPGTLNTAYPLTLSIDESESELSIRAQLQPGRQCKIALSKMLASYRATLSEIASLAVESEIGSLPGFSGSLTSADFQVSAAQPVLAPSKTTQSIANQTGREEADIELMQDLLRNEWRLALGLEEIGSNDDFFRLGGSSLQAATLHARIESATRKSLPLLTLFRSTTLRGMAETLAEDDWPLRSDLAIGLRTTGSQAPLFCVASPEVNTVGYALLSRYQDEDRPIYVLQAPPDARSMRRLSPNELPKMATSYLAELRRLQPSGPYYLLGMCTGSQLVLEMARQLDDAGEQTAFAGIINTWAHYTVSRWYRLQRLINTGHYYVDRMRDLSRLDWREQFGELYRVLRNRSSGLFSRSMPDPKIEDNQSNADSASSDSTDTPKPSDSEIGGQNQGDPWIEDYGWARNDPKASKYPGTLTVFRIRPQQFWRTGEVDLGWRKHATHVHVEHLPGKEHTAILREPHVRIIGQRIAEQIREACRKDAK